MPMPWVFPSGNSAMVGTQLALRVHVVHAKATKTLCFEPQMFVFEACDRVRQQIREAETANNPKDYGLFLCHEDPKKGLWLDNGKTLEHYLLHNGDIIEYRFRYRWLYIRTMDGTKKTLQVDDSKTVQELMVMVCTKMGIYNYEEYSLIRENQDDPEQRDRTLSLRKSTSSAREDKLDRLKRKLHTDDECNWLNPSQTLRQQGIDEKEVLLFRRKYFFSDMNVDARDPVQLNLLYVQLKEAILNGAHPVTQEEAIELAGIQCQVQVGNYSAEKFKPGFLELREFLPKEYMKVKGVEKKIYAQHGNLQNLTEVEAKVKYCQLCRSLKTYGITFFLVKEKIKGKNKLTPRLIGITKDSVVRVDEKTKEVLKTWPLTSIHKWAASSNAFTMDFGEYSPDEYYTAQTTEGEQISQLISGYIDIILKKQKAKDHMGIDGDEESAMYEDNVAPARATIIQHQRTPGPQSAQEVNIAVPGVLRDSQDFTNMEMDGVIQASRVGQVAEGLRRESPDHFMLGGKYPAIQTIKSQTYHIHEFTPAQRALITSINENLEAVQQAKDQLDTPLEIHDVGDDEASRRWLAEAAGASRQKVGDEMGAMAAAVAQVVRSTNHYANAPEDDDLMMMQQSFRVITVHLPSFVEDVRRVAYYEDCHGGDDVHGGEDLLEAARRLADAFADLLRAAQPQEDVDSSTNRKAVLEASTKVGEASTELLRYIQTQEETYDRLDGFAVVEEERRYQDTLLSLAKAVANATAALVIKAKQVATHADDPVNQQRVITAATQTGLATSQLVTCTKVVAPTIQQRACQEQLIEACKEVARAVEGVVEAAQVATQEKELVVEVDTGALAVRTALDELLAHLDQCGSAKGHKDAELDAFMSAYQSIQEETDSQRMVAAARRLAQATAQMIASIKTQAEEHSDPVQQGRLLAAAKQLADATAKLVDAAKTCSSNPQSMELQVTLKQAAEQLTMITYTTGADVLKVRIMKGLQYAARQAVSAATQLVNTSQNAAKRSRASSFQTDYEQICADGKLVADLIPKLVIAIRETRRNPDDPLAQLELISACQQFIEPCEQLSHSSKSMSPTVTEQGLQWALDASVIQMINAITDLKACLARSEPMCRHLELAGALEQLTRLLAEVQAVETSAREGTLMAMPDEQLEQCSHLLAASVRNGTDSTHHLVDAIEREHTDDLGHTSRELAGALASLLQATRGVAADIPAQESPAQREMQLNMVADCRLAIARAHRLVKEARRVQQAVADPHLRQENGHEDLPRLSDALIEALLHCLDGLPGQRDLEITLRHVRERRVTLEKGTATPLSAAHSDLSHSEKQSTFTNSAVELNQATGDLAGSHSPTSFSKTSRRFNRAYDNFVDSGLDLSNSADSGAQLRKNMGDGLTGVSGDSERMLTAAKTVCAEPDTPSLRQNFQQAARSVTESINQLLTVCASSVRPGERECDAALRRLEGVRPLLDNPLHPLTEEHYFHCLENITQETIPLADGLKGMSVGTKEDNSGMFCDSVRRFADSMCHLVEESAHAAYLVGVSDPRSQPGRKAAVDQGHFQEQYQAIRQACNAICAPETSERQDHNVIVSSASSISRSAKALRDSCQTISAYAANPTQKRQLLKLANDTLSGTNELMTCTKTLDSNFSEANRKATEKSSAVVLETVRDLVDFVAQQHFSGQPAKITLDAREAQKPITNAGIEVLDAGCAVILAAKGMAGGTFDEDAYANYSYRSKELSEAIKMLITAIKDSAPGQKECAEAIRRIAVLLRELQEAKMAMMDDKMTPATDNTEEGYQKQISNTVRQIDASVTEIMRAGKGEPEHVGHAVMAGVGYLTPLVNNIIGAATRTESVQNQTTYVEHARTVLEAFTQLLHAVKDCGGHHKACDAHVQIDDMGRGVIESCEDLLNALDKIASQQGNVSTMIDTLSKSVARTQENIRVADDANFADYQARMVQLCHILTHLTEQMVARASSGDTLNDLGPLANSMTQEYNELCMACQGGCATLQDDNQVRRLRVGVKNVGQAAIELVRASGDVEALPTGQVAQAGYQELSNKAKITCDRLAELLAILESTSQGTLACINAASTVSGIIGDLDTTVMFASAGTLNPDELEHPNFSNLRDTIVHTAKALVEDTKTLVTGARSDQNELAHSAQTAVATITRLSDVVKMGAASLGNDQSQAQILLINAVRDVAYSLQTLISATKDVSGRPGSDLDGVKDHAKVTVSNVTTLLRTVKAVEDENQRGSQALETALEALRLDSQSLEQSVIDGSMSTDGVPPNSGRQPTPDELSRLGQPLMAATSRSMAAGTSLRQDDVMGAALSGRQACGDLVRLTKIFLHYSESQETRIRQARIAKNCTDAFIELFEALKELLEYPSKDCHTRMANAARRIADCVHELNQLAESMREGPRLVMYFRPSSPEWRDVTEKFIGRHVAYHHHYVRSYVNGQEVFHSENHHNHGHYHHQGEGGRHRSGSLTETANQIEAASRRLTTLKAQHDSQSNDGDASSTRSEHVLQAVKDVAASSRQLIEVSRSVQKDRGPEVSQWSQSLVSSSRMVGVATQTMVEAAQSYLSGNAGGEERLVGGTRQVAASTAQLLVACKGDSGLSGSSMDQLQNAGQSVKRATEALVRVIQSDSGDQVGFQTMVTSMREIIQTQADIMTKENEVESLRHQLSSMREEQVRQNPQLFSDEAQT